MPFRRYVSIGRVAYVNLAEDPLYGKLVVIVDVVDQNRVRGEAWRRAERAGGAGAARAGVACLRAVAPPVQPAAGACARAQQPRASQASGFRRAAG